MRNEGWTLTRLTGRCLACLSAMLVLLLLHLCMAVTAHADATTTNTSDSNGLTALRLGTVSVDGQQALRLVVETNTPATVKMSLLSAPYRLVIDMRDVGWQIDSLPKKGRLDRSPATAYRFGQPEPGIGRLVIELDSPSAQAAEGAEA